MIRLLVRLVLWVLGLLGLVDDSIGTVASLMVNYRVRHVIVVDNEDRVVGVISIRDLLGDLEAVREVAKLDRYPKVRE